MQMPKATLMNRCWSDVPLVGLGTWKISPQDCAATIDHAMKIGYRAFDCACDYGNEPNVGAALKNAMKTYRVERHELFITGKLWCTFMDPIHVEAACRKSLHDLDLTYMDLYLIHFPIALAYVDPKIRYPPGWTLEGETQPPNAFCDAGLTYSNVTLASTWKALEALVPLGLTRNLGVANFNCTLLRELLKTAQIPPRVNQIEFHPYLAHTAMLKFCARHKIQVIAFHSFGGESLLELGNTTAQTTPALLTHPMVEKIAQKHKSSSAQVLLRWALEQGATVIPKSIQPDRLKANFEVMAMKLDELDMEELKTLDRNLHFNDPNDFADTPIW